MTNKKRSKKSKASKISKFFKKGKKLGWISIFGIMCHAGLAMTDEAKFNFDFSGSEFKVIIAQTAPCCEKAVSSPFV